MGSLVVFGNIVGLVDAVDMDASQVADGSPAEMTMSLDSMVIDESRVRGVNIFRLYSRPGLLSVSENLKPDLEVRGS